MAVATQSYIPKHIPYIAGGWVRGHNYYNRHPLIEYLLHTPEPAVWVVGTRRMGKTSLLRQLELLTDKSESLLVPLFLDLQGSVSSSEISQELAFALDSVAARFIEYDIRPADFRDEDAIALLRRVSRALAHHNKRLLLLMDEAEMLIHVAHADPYWLARLRRVLQEGHLRAVITSTKLLTRLHDVTATWTTSPFLFGFNLANLGELDRKSAIALVRQSQSNKPVEVDDRVVDDILRYTNCNPYLIQHLCHQLFYIDQDGQGRLRPVTEEDLTPNELLAGLFQIDFRHLSKMERRVLLTVAQLAFASEQELLAALSDEAPSRIQTFLYGLHKLGYVRQVGERWAIGNEFLRRWLQDNLPQLSQNLESEVGDTSLEQLLRRGRRQEHTYLHEQEKQLQEKLSQLQEQRRRAGDKDTPDLAQEIEHTETRLSAVRQRLEEMDKGAYSS